MFAATTLARNMVLVEGGGKYVPRKKMGSYCNGFFKGPLHAASTRPLSIGNDCICFHVSYVLFGLFS